MQNTFRARGRLLQFRLYYHYFVVWFVPVKKDVQRRCSFCSCWVVQFSEPTHWFISHTPSSIQQWRSKRLRRWRRERFHYKCANPPTTPCLHSPHLMEISVVFMALFAPAHPMFTALCAHSAPPTER